ncbi:hemerythrin-like [Lingula anatina]|uniref:Hemerythrin-like n=1 Tax=Lingula anatina TaxID=7574 RepID=A0A1S3IZL0_LINAN|nr:hemerythrin-like [Lingula anatina]XP_013420891.1 hemerythrin-like [Lingula anatina]|eukprot:XP_013403436.1 hemerythrin-like [Lingula anatina]
MAFALPEPFKWDDSFAVFYKNLDDEHKALFDAVFNCASKRDQGALGNLQSVSANHFSDEEGMMVKVNLPGFARHKIMHDKFLAVLAAIKCPISDADLLFCKDWLVQHIKVEDHKYKGKL